MTTTTDLTAIAERTAHNLARGDFDDLDLADLRSDEGMTWSDGSTVVWHRTGTDTIVAWAGNATDPDMLNLIEVKVPRDIDLTDITITEIYGDAATFDGDDVRVALDLIVDEYDDESIERDAAEQLMMAGPVVYDHATDLGEGDTWSTPHLFLKQSTLRVAETDGSVWEVRVEAEAWAADWDGDVFRDERRGRTVELVIPFALNEGDAIRTSDRSYEVR